ncbi:MAG TPA: 16S rRNA (guanine(527)-N(7))-methyltransferase RsmG [bacterium]|jgi:16S rRNA (guanine527-N7)-methyltransferase
MTKKIFEAIQGLGWEADDVRWTALAHFATRVEQAGLSLVSHADRERLVHRHIQPSIEGLSCVPESGELLDVGSGGGFPAIPIALARPKLTVTMVESNSRKSAFLQRVSRETGLTNVQVVNWRVESLGALYRGYYHVITARSVADLPELIKWTRKYLVEDGYWLLWKGKKWRDEANLDRLKVELADERTLSDGGRLVLLRRMKAEG